MILRYPLPPNIFSAVLCNLSVKWRTCKAFHFLRSSLPSTKLFQNFHLFPIDILQALFGDEVVHQISITNDILKFLILFFCLNLPLPAQYLIMYEYPSTSSSMMCCHEDCHQHCKVEQHFGIERLQQPALYLLHRKVGLKNKNIFCILLIVCVVCFCFSF